MKSSLNWHTIRTINNSQFEGFEELICQLAYREFEAKDGQFWRIGKPDGGKECYWDFGSEGLSMWQAKFFTSSFTSSQWSQIDKSVKSALDNHKDIKHYYLCIPLDLPDTKAKETTSLLAKYHAKVKGWTTYAKTKGMDVTFHYWGNSELIGRLSKREHEGLLYFWFNSEEFPDSWFENKNSEAINALGARYSNDLNVELALATLFEGMSQSATLEAEARNLFKKILSEYRRFEINIVLEGLLPEKEKAAALFQKLKASFSELRFVKGETITYQAFYALLKDLVAILDNISGELYNIREEQEKDKVREYNRPFSDEIEVVFSFERSLSAMQDYFREDIIHLANNPFLLLIGDAGTGKSHLLADAIVKRQQRGEISLLLLGENFVSRDSPWTQILYNQLRKQTIDEFVFLGALNAKAESMGSRIILFIDALNEGQGRAIWPKNLKTFIDTIKKYKWLGLVLSLRSTYEQLIAPEESYGDDIILRREHNGFADEEYSATKQFFQHYDIALPSAPILNPEFHNPLFLTLLCKSLKAKGMHQLPEGYDGITNIINFFLDAVNFKLSKIEELHYEERRRLVHLAVQKVIGAMVDKLQDFLDYDMADSLVEEVFAQKCYNHEPFLQRLLAEGIFNVDLRWDDNGNSFEVIYLSYQRFQDHIYIRELLARHFNKDKAEASFMSGPLGELVEDEQSCMYNRNLVEALLIQVPEITGKELFDIVPHVRKYKMVSQAWINSLLWRKPGALAVEARDYVNQVIIKDDYLFKQFLLTVISASMKPDFHFNSESLHSFLYKFKMPVRDGYWTIWLQNKYGPDSHNNAISRLIDWAWQDDSKSYLSSESRLLCATAISWFLTSPNRYLRDAATKALVCLYQEHLREIIPLFEKFSGVNDPYITERLYASAYGAVLRSEDLAGLGELTDYIYTSFFKRGYINPHILTRDYARGIIEYALYKGIAVNIKHERIRPPYRSRPLPEILPTNEEIDRKYAPKNDGDNYGREQWGAGAILRSMTTEYGRGTARYGDFGRYTFESGLRDFDVDANGLSNLAVDHIFKMGYDVKLFNKFDSDQGSGRGAGHKERIGKKYQWIAFYEILGRVSDHCSKSDPSSWEDVEEAFEGPWSPYVRDIDPTIIIKQTGIVRFGQSPSSWWFVKPEIKYDTPNKKWLKDTSDMIKVPEVLSVYDPAGEQWLWLNCQVRIGEEEPLEEEPEVAEKSMAYEASSFIIRESDKDKMLAGLPLVGDRDLPEAESRYEIFSREYYWSPAHQYFFKPYYRGERWQELHTKHGIHLGKAHRTAEYYLWEESYDCSKDETIGYYKPTDLLFNGMNLQFGKAEGEFTDKQGNLVCFDPSVSNTNFAGLLFKAKPLREWLEQNKMVLVWNVYAEKLVFAEFGRSPETGRTTYNSFFHLEGKTIAGDFTAPEFE